MIEVSQETAKSIYLKLKQVGYTSKDFNYKSVKQGGIKRQWIKRQWWSMVVEEKDLIERIWDRTVGKGSEKRVIKFKIRQEVLTVETRRRIHVYIYPKQTIRRAYSGFIGRQDTNTNGHDDWGMRLTYNRS